MIAWSYGGGWQSVAIGVLIREGALPKRARARGRRLHSDPRATMRITYVDQGDDGEPILVKMTDEEVLAEYYPHWCRLMLRAGKLLEVTPEKCIDDYIVVHWATID